MWCGWGCQRAKIYPLTIPILSPFPSLASFFLIRRVSTHFYILLRIEKNACCPHGNDVIRKFHLHVCWCCWQWCFKQISMTSLVGWRISTLLQNFITISMLFRYVSWIWRRTKLSIVADARYHAHPYYKVLPYLVISLVMIYVHYPPTST